MRNKGRSTRRPLAALTLAALTLALVAGCGDENPEARPGKIAECLEEAGAPATTAETVREEAVGAVDILRPNGTIQVFQSESAAKDFVDASERPGPTQIGSITIDSRDPRAIELARQCADA